MPPWTSVLAKPFVKFWDVRGDKKGTACKTSCGGIRMVVIWLWSFAYFRVPLCTTAFSITLVALKCHSDICLLRTSWNTGSYNRMMMLGSEELKIVIITSPIKFPFSALTLLVGWQEACKKLGVGLLVVTIWLEFCMTYSSSCHHHFHHP